MQEVNSLTGLRLTDFRVPVSHDLSHVLLHALQFCDVLFQRIEFAFEHFEDSFAGSSAVIPRAQNLSKFGQRKSEAESVPDHGYALEAVRRVNAVTR
jgi:hypothetical protein